MPNYKILFSFIVATADANKTNHIQIQNTISLYYLGNYLKFCVHNEKFV